MAEHVVDLVIIGSGAGNTIPDDRFDDRTTVRPGHGLATTLGDERPSLRAWRERRW